MLKNEDEKRVIDSIGRGGVGIMPTDTVYGVAASALMPAAVERLYILKKRDAGKPPVVIIASVSDLKKFGIKITRQQDAFLETVWPGPVSIILPLKSKRFVYLHRGKKSVAFRLPADAELRKLLRKTGPLATSSANIQARKPAQTIREARKYFGEVSDFYLNWGPRRGLPSTIVKVESAKIKVLRQGAVHVET